MRFDFLTSLLAFLGSLSPFPALMLLVMVFLSLPACSSPGTATTPITTQGAQTVGQDQGSAQATESGSATATANPVIVNAFAAKTVRVSPDGSIDIESNPDAVVEVGGGASFGNATVDTQDIRLSSGGGAAGGTGGTARAASSGGNTQEGGDQ